MKRDYYNKEDNENSPEDLTTNSAQSVSLDMYSSPKSPSRTAKITTAMHKVEYGGSKLVRRRQKRNSIYDEIVI